MNSNYRQLETITEEELQACGLEKQATTFGFGNQIYKDANNTYIVDYKTKKPFFSTRNNNTERKYE